jgi:hypothetical protein
MKINPIETAKEPMKRKITEPKRDLMGSIVS